MYWTEGGPHYTGSGNVTDWCEWGGTFSATSWQLVQAPSRRGTWRSMSRDGRISDPDPAEDVVPSTRRTKEMTRSGQYWAFAHYSSADAARSAPLRFRKAAATDLQHVAVENPDGQRVLVVTNPGRPRRWNCGWRAWRSQIPLRRKFDDDAGVAVKDWVRIKICVSGRTFKATADSSLHRAPAKDAGKAKTRAIPFGMTAR